MVMAIQLLSLLIQMCCTMLSMQLDDFQERLVDTCWNDEDVGHLVCLSATVKLTHHPGLNSDLYMWIWMSQNNGWKMIRQVHLESVRLYSPSKDVYNLFFPSG